MSLSVPADRDGTRFPILLRIGSGLFFLRLRVVSLIFIVVRFPAVVRNALLEIITLGLLDAPSAAGRPTGMGLDHHPPAFLREFGRDCRGGSRGNDRKAEREEQRGNEGCWAFHGVTNRLPWRKDDTSGETLRELVPSCHSI